MAGAIIDGILSSGLFQKEEITVCDKAKEALKKFEGLCVSQNNLDVLSCGYVVLAVKPNVLRSVLEEIANSGSDFSNIVFISIVAGACIEDIRSSLGSNAKVIRVMPNTPAMVGEGMSVLASHDETVTEQEFSIARNIFDSVGKTEVISEKLMDSVTGVSGSGPAYVYMLIEAMADAGVHEGLPRDMAYRLAAQTVLGASKTVLETGEHPAKLKDAVCSPGGTTIEAVAKLEEKGFRSAVIDAIHVCVKKAKTLL